MCSNGKTLLSINHSKVDNMENLVCPLQIVSKENKSPEMASQITNIPNNTEIKIDQSTTLALLISTNKNYSILKHL